MNSIDCALNREITFIDLDKQELFKLPSWNYIRENGGLKNIIDKMGRNYGSIINEYAFQQALFRITMFPSESREGCEWLTTQVFQTISEIYNNPKDCVK